MNFKIHDATAPKCTTKRITGATQTIPGVITLRNHLAGTHVNPEIAKPGVSNTKLELLGFIENTKELALTSCTSGKNEFLVFNSDRIKTFTPTFTSGVGNISFFLVGHGGNGKHEKETSVNVTLRGITYILTAKPGKFEPAETRTGGSGGDAILVFENPDANKTHIIASGGKGGEKAEKGSNEAFDDKADKGVSETFSNEDVQVLLGGGGGGFWHGGGSSYFGGGASTPNLPGMTVGLWGGMGCWQNNSMTNGFGGGVGAQTSNATMHSFGGGGGGAIFALFKNVPAGTIFNVTVPNGIPSTGGQGIVIVDY